MGKYYIANDERLCGPFCYLRMYLFYPVLLLWNAYLLCCLVIGFRRDRRLAKYSYREDNKTAYDVEKEATEPAFRIIITTKIGAGVVCGVVQLLSLNAFPNRFLMSTLEILSRLSYSVILSVPFFLSLHRLASIALASATRKTYLTPVVFVISLIISSLLASFCYFRFFLLLLLDDVVYVKENYGFEIGLTHDLVELDLLLPIARISLALFSNLFNIASLFLLLLGFGGRGMGRLLSYCFLESLLPLLTYVGYIHASFVTIEFNLLLFYHHKIVWMEMVNSLGSGVFLFFFARVLFFTPRCSSESEDLPVCFRETNAQTMEVEQPPQLIDF